MRVEEPPLEVLPVDRLQCDDNGRVLFAAIDETHRLCFESAQSNVAGQWTITNQETGYVVTLTMPSFWSNKVFAWLDRRRTIWEQETHA